MSACPSAAVSWLRDKPPRSHSCSSIQRAGPSTTPRACWRAHRLPNRRRQQKNKSNKHMITKNKFNLTVGLLAGGLVLLNGPARPCTTVYLHVIVHTARIAS